jgi:hypothetical protein
MAAVPRMGSLTVRPVWPTDCQGIILPADPTRTWTPDNIPGQPVVTARNVQVFFEFQQYRRDI